MAKDTSVREYLALEQKYAEVFNLVGQGEDLNIDDLRRALDDIYNAGRDKGRPVVGVNGRTAQLEINDLAVRLEDGGMSPNSARREAERIGAVIRSEGFMHGLAEAKRKVLAALTGKEV
jgi:hypothetical protein